MISQGAMEKRNILQHITGGLKIFASQVTSSKCASHCNRLLKDTLHVIQVKRIELLMETGERRMVRHLKTPTEN
jgi:hypothetical protein